MCVYKYAESDQIDRECGVETDYEVGDIKRGNAVMQMLPARNLKLTPRESTLPTKRETERRDDAKVETWKIFPSSRCFLPDAVGAGEVSLPKLL